MMVSRTDLPSVKALLDGGATTDQLASAIIGNAVRRDGGVPVADSRAIAEVFGKQHGHVLRSIDTILRRHPDLVSNFGEQSEAYTAGKGAERRRRYFTLDRKAFNVLVLGFTGAQRRRDHDALGQRRRGTQNTPPK